MEQMLGSRETHNKSSKRQKSKEKLESGKSGRVEYLDKHMKRADFNAWSLNSEKGQMNSKNKSMNKRTHKEAFKHDQDSES